MLIKSFPSGPLSTNCYIVACPNTRQAAIIDPAPDSVKSLIPFCTEHKIQPIAILLTHSHWDHIADVSAVKEKYNIPVYIHAEDAGNLIAPGSDGLQCWVDISSVQPDGFFKEGDIFPIGDLRFQVIHTPGHSPGGVCFYLPQNKVLMAGDTLFKGSIGTLSLPTARPRLMWESLKKLSLLPPDTIVYPGHGPHTTIGNESWLVEAESYFG